MLESKRIVILGGGLAGLTAAYRLKKIFNDGSILLLEKTSNIGGMAQTIQEGEYSFDLTGHALHLNREESKDFIFEELGLEHRFNKVVRSAFIYIDGKFIPYPFQYNLSYLDKRHRDYCVTEFLKAYYIKDTPQVPKTFERYSCHFFGKGISKLFMLPYNEKLWSTDLSQMSIDWMGEYVPGPDYQKVLEGAYIKKNIDNSGYNATFYYPKTGGIQILSDAIYEHVNESVILNSPVTRIDVENKIVYSAQRSFKYEYLLSTIPLPNLMRMTDLHVHADKLKHNVTRAFFVALPRSDAPKCSWIYIPDASKKTYRIGNFSWFSSSLIVNGKDVLYIETSASHDLMERLPTFDDMLSDLKELSVLNTESIELIKIIDIDPSYVTYDLQWRDNISCITKKLKSHDIFLAGRYGSWKYDSMEGAIIDGLASASLINNMIHGMQE